MSATKIYSTATWVLVLLVTSLPAANAGEQERYLVEFENTWSELTHPGLFPHEAHFSWVGGGTHNEQVSLWSVGEVASPAMVEMQESGVTKQLTRQIRTAMANGEAFSVVDQRHWFCPSDITVPSCGPLSFEVEVDSDFPLMTLVTMLGPSPDWFVGVDGLPLRNDSGWVNFVEIDLHPYDGGSRSANVFALWGPQNDPPDPITPITPESGQIVTGDSLGKLFVSRILECDLDRDFLCSSTDIDLLTTVVQTSEARFDLDGSGTTDEGDRRFWVEQLMGTQFGDTDLDGKVDFGDFLALAANYQQAAGWAGGDFDGSGTTSFDDFLVLAQNFAAGDANVVVPEPAGHLTVVFIIGWLFGFGRRRAGSP